MSLWSNLLETYDAVQDAAGIIPASLSGSENHVNPWNGRLQS